VKNFPSMLNPGLEENLLRKEPSRLLPGFHNFNIFLKGKVTWSLRKRDKETETETETVRITRTDGWIQTWQVLAACAFLLAFHLYYSPAAVSLSPSLWLLSYLRSTPD
jgi:hypothetical protein